MMICVSVGKTDLCVCMCVASFFLFFFLPDYFNTVHFSHLEKSLSLQSALRKIWFLVLFDSQTEGQPLSFENNPVESQTPDLAQGEQA